MNQIAVKAHWHGPEYDPLDVVEARARSILNLYGLGSVMVKALRDENEILLELTGPREGALKAKYIFEP